MKLVVVKIIYLLIAIIAPLGIGTSPAQYNDDQTKTLKVKEIEFKGEPSLQQVSQLLEEQTEIHEIDLINWQKFSYKPNVIFRIAYSKNHIWLKYYVQEESIIAAYTNTNEPVSRDSCVEFFFDPKADGNYYNFEFNCIGTRQLSYGSTINNRQFVDSELMENQIKIKSSLGNKSFTVKTGGHSWEMTIIIPSKILINDQGVQLKGLRAKANFYKCGDHTSIPHYLSWNPVRTESPDFHQSKYFGDVLFE